MTLFNWLSLNIASTLPHEKGSQVEGKYCEDDSGSASGRIRPIAITPFAQRTSSKAVSVCLSNVLIHSIVRSQVRVRVQMGESWPFRLNLKIEKVFMHCCGDSEDRFICRNLSGATGDGEKPFLTDINRVFLFRILAHRIFHTTIEDGWTRKARAECKFSVCVWNVLS